MWRLLLDCSTEFDLDFRVLLFEEIELGVRAVLLLPRVFSVVALLAFIEDTGFAFDEPASELLMDAAIKC